MMMLRSVLVLVSFALLLGCEFDSHTTVKPPAVKAWTAEDIDAAVNVEQRSIYSPAPAINGQPPLSCDYIRYMSLKPKDMGSNPDAVLLLNPGGLLGIGSMSHLAKNLIYMAETFKNTHIEVLIIERRANCLEDLTGVNAAEAEGNIQAAIDYYYNGKSIGGKTFQGFVTSETAPYLSEFGVELNVEDIYTVITTEIPDPQIRRQKLFLAGHSYGGFILGLFMGWDFDGNPETKDDAGYRNCAGAIGLESLIAPYTVLIQGMAETLPDMMEDQMLEMVYGSDYDTQLADLRAGNMSRIYGGQMLPEPFMLMELVAMRADWAPFEKSTFFNDVPYSKNAHQFINTVLSGTAIDVMQPNGYKKIPCTNLALAGLLMDNNFLLLGSASLSMGFLINGEVADKEFPIPGILEQIPLVSSMLSPIVPPNLYYPTDKYSSTLYHWVNFDEIDQSQYTTQNEEVVDINDYLKASYEGSTNYFEWYMPYRMMLDMMYFGKNNEKTDACHFDHPDFMNHIPILEFIAEFGIIKPYVDISTRNTVYLPGYNHSDPIMAAANRLERRPNEVVGPLIDFIMSNIKISE